MSKKDSLMSQMTAILNEIRDGAEEAAATGIKKVSKTTPAKLKERSPRKTGEFAGGWRVKRVSNKHIIVYNAKQPGLTHLLEKGHAIVNKKGRFGRVEGTHFMEKVDDEEQQVFYDAVMDALNREL